MICSPGPSSGRLAPTPHTNQPDNVYDGQPDHLEQELHVDVHLVVESHRREAFIERLEELVDEFAI